MTNPKYRAWSWTHWEDKISQTDLQHKLLESVFSVFGRETCPTTGKVHFQGYTYLKNPRSFNGWRKFLGEGCHTEPAKGTPAENVQYCSKGEQSKTEWQECKDQGENYGLNSDVWTHGEQPKQGVRSDLITLRDLASKAQCVSDLYQSQDEGTLSSLARYPRFVAAVAAAAQKKRTREWRNVEVIVNYGKTGLGKTRGPYEEGAYMWHPPAKGQKEWWDGYDGEEILLIDEFYGQLTIDRMFVLMDGYQIRLEIKNGFTYAQWTKIYITSNINPKEWYKNCPDAKWDALNRRFSKIVHFTDFMVPEQ